jgi:hypothetical protein
MDFLKKLKILQVAVSNPELPLKDRLQAGETLWKSVDEAHRGLDILKKDLTEITLSKINKGSLAFETPNGKFWVTIPKPRHDGTVGKPRIQFREK